MLFSIFVIVTLLEIFVLVSVGGVIGAFSTVVLVIITALIGSTLLKRQGLTTLAKAQEKVYQGQEPAFEMLEGVIILLSGVLLLTPGFLTDIVGLAGLVPLSRKYFINQFLRNNADKFFNAKIIRSTTKKTRSNNKTIEGEFWED